MHEQLRQTNKNQKKSSDSSIAHTTSVGSATYGFVDNRKKNKTLETVQTEMTKPRNGPFIQTKRQFSKPCKKKLHDGEMIQRYTNGQFDDPDTIGYLRAQGYLQVHPNTGWNPVTGLGPKKENAFRALDNAAFNAAGNAIWNWYPHINFVYGAANRIEHPENIDQARTGTCGVVAIQYIQASSQPSRYIDAITDIYFNGRLNGVNIQAAQATRPGDDNSGLDDIDWLYIVPFRHIKNDVFSYKGETGAKGNLRAVTTPGTVAKWMTSELNATRVEQNYVFSGAWNAVTALENQINDLRVVVLYISSDGTPAGSGHMPNHFVVLNGVTVIPGPQGNRQVDLDIYTWGGLHTIRLNERQVRDYTWKVIVGTLP